MTIALMARNVRGSFLWGIVDATIFSIIARSITGTTQFAPEVAEVPSKWVGMRDFRRIGHFSFSFFSELGVLTAVLAIVLADFFEVMGTLIGDGSLAGYLDENGDLPVGTAGTAGRLAGSGRRWRGEFLVGDRRRSRWAHRPGLALRSVLKKAVERWW